MTLGKVLGAGRGARAQGRGSGLCRGPTCAQPKPPACMALAARTVSRSRAAAAATAMVVRAAQYRTQRCRLPWALTTLAAGDQSCPWRGGMKPGGANHERGRAGFLELAANAEQEAGLFLANP